MGTIPVAAPLLPEDFAICTKDVPFPRHGVAEAQRAAGLSTPTRSSECCRVSPVSTLAKSVERIIEHHGHCKIDFFFAELVPHAARIVCDKYGNYVIQTLLENGPQPWRRRCLDLILKAAPPNGHAGRYFRCTLSSAFERSRDEYMLRLLAPLRPLFETAECNAESVAADCDST